MPRWVKWLVNVGVGVLLLIVILLLTGGHGPGDHAQAMLIWIVGGTLDANQNIQSIRQTPMARTPG